MTSMMKKIEIFLLVLVLAAAMSACKSSGAMSGTVSNAENAEEMLASEDGTYEVAFVTDGAPLKDSGINERTYDGVKLYATSHGKSYRFCSCENGTKEARVAAMQSACDSGAQIVLCAGLSQGEALAEAAENNPRIRFIWLGGDEKIARKNVAVIAFFEEQAGYLAGYAAVCDGYETLCFAGDENEWRIGAGLAQGAAAAAEKLGKTAQITYGDAPSGDSAFTLGADEGTLKTAMLKHWDAAAMWALDRFYDGTFSDLCGKVTQLGAAEGAVGLQMDNWVLKNYTISEYRTVLGAMADGTITVFADDEPMR